MLVSLVLKAPVGLYVYSVTSDVESLLYVAVTTIPAGSNVSPSVYVVFVGSVVTAILSRVLTSPTWYKHSADVHPKQYISLQSVVPQSHSSKSLKFTYP